VRPGGGRQGGEGREGGSEGCECEVGEEKENEEALCMPWHGMRDHHTKRKLAF